MTQQEFESLIGKEIETDTFDTVVNPMYMATNLDKQDFACDVKKHGLIDSTVAQELTAASENLRDQVEDLRCRLLGTVNFLLSRNEAACNKQAIKLIGHKEVIRLKMQNNYLLDDDDRAFILSMFD